MANDAILRSNSQELMMTIVPIRETYPDRFPNCPPLDTLLSQVPDVILCQALVHYGFLASCVSISVLSNIFKICTIIVKRIDVSDSGFPLAKLYQIALR